MQDDLYQVIIDTQPPYAPFFRVGLRKRRKRLLGGMRARRRVIAKAHRTRPSFYDWVSAIFVTK